MTAPTARAQPAAHLHLAPYTHSFCAMTTQCDLTFYGVDTVQGDAIAATVEARVMFLATRYNFHSADSWLTQSVNERRHNRVAIDADFADVLTTVREHTKRCGGVFDITVGTLAQRIKLAKSTRDIAQIKKQLQRFTGLARWSVGCDTSGHYLEFDNPITRIDLGGVIKEYAVDESACVARAAGVESGIVNYGGDLSCWGKKPDGQRFIAGVPDPRSPEHMLFGLDLLDQAMTTSGHYARRRSLKDGEASHIVGPQRSPWLSCSVVSKSALISGIYSTALLLTNTNLVSHNLPPETLAVVVNRAGEVQHLN